MARTKAAQFRITPEEDQFLRYACLDAGFDQLSEYLRSVLLDGTVVSVGRHRVRMIASRTSDPADDAEIRERLTAILTVALQSSSVGGDGGMVGSTPSQSPPDAAAAPSSAGPPENQASAPRSAGPVPAVGPDQNGQGSPHGARSGEFEGTPAPRDSQLEATAIPASSAESPPVERKTTAPPPVPFVGASGACPDCGGTNGRHQGFCAQVTGEEPVSGTEDAPAAPESEQAFIARRIAEQEADGIGTAVAQHIAEAEWRKTTAPQEGSSAPTPPPPAPETQQPCPTCGAMKIPSQQCRDCGTRPTTI